MPQISSYSYDSATGQALRELAGISERGTLQNPIVHDPVKWYWGAHSAAGYIKGSLGATYDSGPQTLTASDSVDAFQVIDTAEWIQYNVVDGYLQGGAAAYAAGPQIGDRVFYDDALNTGYQGIYIFANVGSGVAPWVLLRADDQREADILDAFYVEVEDTDIAIQTVRAETDPAWIYPSVRFGAGGQAFGPASVAGVGGVALGSGAVAGIGGYAFGANSAAGVDGVAIGTNVAAPAGTVKIGTAPYGTIAIDKYAQITQDDAELDFAVASLFDLYIESLGVQTEITFTTANLTRGRTVRVMIEAVESVDFVFPAGWIWSGSAPAGITAGDKAMLTLTSHGSDSFTFAEYVSS